MIAILVITADVQLTQFIELGLKSENYQITTVNDGLKGLTLAREIQPDLILFDSIILGVSGLELCRRLRLTGDRVPIILITTQDEIGDRVAGLDAGADDYIVKPFNIQDLLTRIKANLRQNPESNSSCLQFHDLQLNSNTREVYRGKRSLELTAKEFDLLEYLLTHPRQVLTRDQILQAVWGYDFMGDSNIIEVYVRYLRLKLEADGEKRLIHTVRGVGYVLKDS